MKRIFTCLCLLAACHVLVFSQKLAPDFTATDTEGITHSLYADYLAENKLVVVHLFFVNCPPCNQIADDLGTLYKKLGEGKGKVQFLEFSILSGDTNEEIRNYKSDHKLTFPSFGYAGGSDKVFNDYTDQKVGAYSGTPHFTLVKPDGTYVYDILFADLESEIEKGTVVPSNEVNINYISGLKAFPDNSAFYLRSHADSSYNKLIVSDTSGFVRFNYPSEDYPLTEDAYIEFHSSAALDASRIDVNDLVVVRRHILRLKLMEGIGLITGDVTADGRIDVSDIVEMRKVILRLQSRWSHNIENYIMVPSELPLEIDQKISQTLKFSPMVVAMGNVVE